MTNLSPLAKQTDYFNPFEQVTLKAITGLDPEQVKRIQELAVLRHGNELPYFIGIGASALFLYLWSHPDIVKTLIDAPAKMIDAVIPDSLVGV